MSVRLRRQPAAARQRRAAAARRSFALTSRGATRSAARCRLARCGPASSRTAARSGIATCYGTYSFEGGMLAGIAHSPLYRKHDSEIAIVGQSAGVYEGVTGSIRVGLAPAATARTVRRHDAHLVWR